MSETERAAALKEVQLELFELKRKFQLIASEHWKEFRLAKRELVRKQLLLFNSGTKSCRKCNEVMDVEQFYRDDRYADGRRPYCIECDSAGAKERYRRRKAA